MKREFAVIKKNNNKNMRPSIPRTYGYNAIYSIMNNSESVSLSRQRGLNLTEEQIKDILYNIPKEFEDCVRFVDGPSDFLPYEKKEEVPEVPEIPEIPEVPEAPEEEAVKTTEVPDEEIENPSQDNLEDSFSDVQDDEQEEEDLLNVDYSKFTKQEEIDYVKKLKQHAAEKGIKISPATKKIETILEKLKQND